MLTDLFFRNLEGHTFVSPSRSELEKLGGNLYKNYIVDRYVQVFSLFSGRHPLPVDDPIFPSTNDPMDFDFLERAAIEKLRSHRGCRILVYLTGLSPAIIALVNVCRELEIQLSVAHYDQCDGHYLLQEVYK